ncbi:MAG: lytic transglycosylase domain-containing protein [Thermoleophilia bacterium]
MARPNRRSTGTVVLAAALGMLLVPVALAICVALAFGEGAGGCGAPAAVAGKVHGVPARLVPIYRAAAARYGLGPKGPAILAGINWEETGFGTNLGVSSAAAEGWMQFLPSSWEAFGVDGDGDGKKDPYDPWDAIFAAARLLRYSGAPGDWHGAIFSYNHADWYVEDVLRDARKFAPAIGNGAGVGDCEAAALAPNEALAKMIAEADRLSAIRPRTSYVYGGSHGESPTPADGPFDCSSAVSHLLQIAGLGNPTMDTIALLGWAEPGPGRWVSIYDKPYGPEAHTFIEFAPGLTPPSKRFWGTSGFVAPGQGPGWIPESTFSAGYLSGFRVLHPAGL